MSTATRQWVYETEARRILGCSRPAFAKLIRDGRLSVRSLPGAYDRYDREELERLATEFTRPAAKAS